MAKMKMADKRLRFSDKNISSQFKSLNSSNRINLQKAGSKLSVEEFGNGTASGPLNPFLEQILKELPSANMPSEAGNSTAFTGNIAAFNEGYESIKSSSKDALSKKIRNNIEKQTLQISKKQVQNSLLNNFNITSTAALLAASNKNTSGLNLDSMITKTQNNSSLNVSAKQATVNFQAGNRISQARIPSAG